MRTHFISRLALLLAAGFLVVVSRVWTGDTLQWLFVAGGAFTIIVAAADGIGKYMVQRGLDGLLVLLGAWTIIQAFVYGGATLGWMSFACGCALAILSTIGLIVHETSTERVVHELSVTTSSEPQGVVNRL